MLSGCSGGGGSESVPNEDRCASDADCSGGSCWRYPDGVRDCALPPETQPGGCEDATDGVTCECTKNEDCPKTTDARCMPKGWQGCSGLPPPQVNVCVYGWCATDAQCTSGSHGRCVPPGAYGNIVHICSYGACRFSADCVLRPEGECRYEYSKCLSATSYCVYGDDPCREDADCPNGKVCAPREDNQGTECAEPPLPPQ